MIPPRSLPSSCFSFFSVGSPVQDGLPLFLAFGFGFLVRDGRLLLSPSLSLLVCYPHLGLESLEPFRHKCRTQCPATTPNSLRLVYGSLKCRVPHESA